MPASWASYEGTDMHGRVVRLTVAGVDVPTFVRIAPAKEETHYPDPDWTSKIGAGTAASAQH